MQPWPLNINGKKFANLELAWTPEDLRTGLTGRESIPPDGGMIFRFETEERLLFQMKNLAMPLEAVFINDRNRIVAIKTMRPEPPRQPEESDAEYENRLPGYSSGCPARIVLELPPGSAAELKLQVGARFPVDLGKLLSGKFHGGNR